MKKIFVAVISIVIVALYFAIPTNNVMELQTENAFDLTDNEMLVGWADVVFVGRVIEKTGEKSDDISPITYYDVEVNQVIKGEISGQIQVSHRIGYSNLHRATIKTKNDDYLIKGKTYLLIARYNEELESYTIVPVYGKLELDAETEKSLTDKYTNSYKNEKKPNF